MTFYRRFCATTLALLALTACGKSSKSTENAFQNPLNRAAADIRRSFAVAPIAAEGLVDEPPAHTSALKLDKTKISIEKSALEKEFLLQASLVSQQNFPSFHGQKSRVVFFRRVENKLYMIEASKGLEAAKNYPQTLVMAEFPIINETEQSLTFDFNVGMSRLFSSGDWYARDFAGAAPNVEYRSVKTAFSYLERAAFAEGNLLEIHQFAQLEQPQTGGGVRNAPIEAVYYLSPYLPNPNFVPTRAPRNFDNMGFFEASPQYNDESGIVHYAAKRDINQPIVYAISANTPAEYKDAVRDGILYWNKAFGKEVVKVIDAPAGVFAPHPTLNIVQWVDFDSAGFAYADAQLDPRTGEVLHQQVYFTSAWARIGRTSLDEISRQQAPRALFGLTGFESTPMCDLDLGRMLQAGPAPLLLERDPAKITKSAGDLIREVVAHEVGHTLGLRHNFAGSLAANYRLDERETLFKDYLASGHAKDDLVTSSSVMDYQFPLEAMMTGDQIARGKYAGEYDTKAIETLYLGKQYAASSLPLFCTDSGIGQYLDCMPYDAGNSYVAWVKYNSHDYIQKLPNKILERFILAKAPPFGGQPVDIGEVPLNPELNAIVTLTDETEFLNLLKRDSHLLSVERSFPVVASYNEEEVRAKTIEVVKADLGKNGGLDGVFIDSTDAALAGLDAKFESLLANPDIVRGVGSNGKAYEFTAGEISAMKEISKKFFKKYRAELVKSEVKVLAGESLFPVENEDAAKKPKPAKFDNSALAEDFAGFLGKRMKVFVTSTSGEPSVYKRSTTPDWTNVKNPGTPTLPDAKKVEVTFTLPHFTFPTDVRKTAATMLRADRSEQPGWGYGQRQGSQKALKAIVDAALPGVTLTTPASYEDFPQEIVSWILDVTAVQKALE